MPEQRKISCIILFFILMSFLSGYGQGNNSSWLQRSWYGRAFILSNGPKENYDLVLTIGKIKGKNFEGSLKTINPSDTTIQFNTKVEGFIYEKHMQINIGTWKVNCGNCKPQTLAFSIENGKFYLKGEAKGCSQECTWITVFSKDLIDFDLKTQDDLFAAAEEIIIEPADTTVALAQNSPPAEPEPEKTKEPEITPRIAILPAGAVLDTQKDLTSASGKPNINKNAGLKVNDAVPEKRIPVITAGSVVVNEKPPALNNNPKEGIDKNAGLKINDAVPEKRIPVIAAAPVVVGEKSALVPAEPANSINKNAGLKINDAVPERRITLLEAGNPVAVNKPSLIALGNPPTSITKNPGLNVNDAVPEKRIPVIAAGSVVANNKPPVVPVNPSGNITKTSGLKVDETIPEKKIPILAAGTVVAAGKNNAVLNPQQNKNSLQNQPSLKVDQSTKVKPPAIPVKDTTSGLPEGYAERKKNVVTTIDVNTDSITLRLYDNGVVDGDVVSIVYNDHVVVDKLSLIARALVIKLAVRKDIVNKLVFHAHNLGEFPPNTAKLEVLYGTKREELTISSDYTISSAIDIVYQQK